VSDDKLQIGALTVDCEPLFASSQKNARQNADLPIDLYRRRSNDRFHTAKTQLGHLTTKLEPI